jgi:DNA-binding response OmpR family regulator
MKDPIDILLVEDSPTQALQFQLLLTRAGYRISVARNGADGWRQACDVHPRIILLDIDLPQLDGFQVLARLKRGRDTAAIPVIMLTSREHISNVERALALGAADYLPKEEALQTVCDAVAQLIGPAAGAPAAR